MTQSVKATVLPNFTINVGKLQQGIEDGNIPTSNEEEFDKLRPHNSMKGRNNTDL